MILRKLSLRNSCSLKEKANDIFKSFKNKISSAINIFGNYNKIVRHI